MKKKQIYQVLCSLFLVLISTSLMVSTLHSHNHIEWHHPQQHVDTGHCLTVDSTVCPICAYLFKTDLNTNVEVKYHFNSYKIVENNLDNCSFSSFYTTLKGRSPPSSV